MVGAPPGDTASGSGVVGSSGSDLTADAGRQTRSTASTTPTVTWTLVSGPGSISNATGTQVTYNAPAAPGTTGTAVIMATHDLDLVRRSNYRTIELNHGRLVFDSAESPASARPFDEPFDVHDTPTGSTETI